jgi:thiol:disulfide interchange protein DsbA
MKNFFASALWIIPFLALAGCGEQTPTSEGADQATAAEASPPESPAEPAPAAENEAATAAPVESVSETDEPADTTSTVQPSLRLGSAPAGPPTSAQFREGANYQKIVPAQPTSVAPGKVEVAEVFWYGCAHCFSLEPAIKSWRDDGAPPYVEFVRIPAMWNDITRMHARVYFTAQALGKLDQLHPLIFREIHVNGNQLNTHDRISAFFTEHGVSAEDFDKTFSSFAVENQLQRADFLNRRFRVDSVPLVVVNGKYKTDLSSAGGEAQLFTLINELATHEHGG